MKHSVEQSPKGDLGVKRGMEGSKASRKLKAGKDWKASSWLPFRPESMQGDSPGIKVRTATPDKVV